MFIPVGKCENEDCLFRFTRILPDELTPYKHYRTEVIEDVVDEVCTPEDPQTQDYPCEKTMDRWKSWISGNQTQIDGALKSLGSRIFEFDEELLSSEESLMDELRQNGAGWLAVINQVMYNFRMPVLNDRQLTELSTALSGVPDPLDLGSPCKEESPHEGKGYSELAGQHRFGSLQYHSAFTESGP